jgi:hypothetical protein
MPCFYALSAAFFDAVAAAIRKAIFEKPSSTPSNKQAIVYDDAVSAAV